MKPTPVPGDLVPIDAEGCVALLGQAPWARVGFVVDDVPTVLPVNILVRDDAIYFRTAAGSKLGSAAASSRVAVQADGGDTTHRIGWSVLVTGRSSIVTDHAEEESLLSLPFEPWALPDDKHFWVRVDVEAVSGRRIVRD